MKCLLGCALLLGAGLEAQTVQSTLLELNGTGISRKVLSNQLVDEIMAMAKHNQAPSRATAQRFSEDLTSALIGREMTNIRAAALQKAISDVLSGKGSTHAPASSLLQTLTSCGIDNRTAQAIVGRFLDLGQEVRGPDDLGILPTKLR